MVSSKRIGDAIAALEKKDKGTPISETANEWGVGRKYIDNAIRDLRTAVSRGEVPTEVLPDGFWIRQINSQVDADGNVQKQWLSARPRAGSNFMEPVGEGWDVVRKSSFLNGDEISNQWVITEPSKTAPIEKLVKLAESIRENIAPLPHEIPYTTPTTYQDAADELVVYPLADLHLGLLASKLETGVEWNVKKASEMFRAIIDEMVSRTPPSDTALIINLGDFLHLDGVENLTPRGKHRLDVDQKYFDIVIAGLELFYYAIERIAQRHKKVIVFIRGGNHDGETAMIMSLVLLQRYGADPRIEINVNPGPADSMVWGRTLIAAHHGHSYKIKDLPQIMATDYRKEWGETEKGVWYIGHFHTERVITTGDVTVKIIQPLTQRDEWTHSKGYRGGAGLVADVYHKLEGFKGNHSIESDYILNKLKG